MTNLVGVSESFDPSLTEVPSRSLKPIWKWLFILGGVFGSFWLVKAWLDNQFFWQKTAVVVLDPQYPIPGNDGRNQINDLYPLKVNWDLAQRVSQILIDEYRISVRLTREDLDEVVSPEDRAALAEDVKAKLLVRIDCSTRPGAGYRVYYADRFKAGDAGKVEASRQAARHIDRYLQEKTKDMLMYNELSPESNIPMAATERSSWYSEMPSVTVEAATLTNMFDALFVEGEMGQNRTAQAIAAGIAAYLRETKALL